MVAFEPFQRLRYLGALSEAQYGEEVFFLVRRVPWSGAAEIFERGLKRIPALRIQHTALVGHCFKRLQKPLDPAMAIR